MDKNSPTRSIENENMLNGRFILFLRNYDFLISFFEFGLCLYFNNYGKVNNFIKSGHLSLSDMFFFNSLLRCQKVK